MMIKALKKGMTQLFMPSGEVCPVTEVVVDNGDEISNFKEGLKVVISGVSKGRGFAGVMKRWNFSGGPATHGSGWLRKPGSIGGTTSPGRVYKGKKMPGHMGCRRVTLKNVSVLRIDNEKKTLFLKGCFPGSRNSKLLISLPGEMSHEA